MMAADQLRGIEQINLNIRGAIFNLKYLDKNENKYVGTNIIVNAYYIWVQHCFWFLALTVFKQLLIFIASLFCSNNYDGMAAMMAPISQSRT